MRAPVEIVEDVHRILGRMAYFQDMAPEAVERLGANSHAVSLRRGEVLVNQGNTHPGNIYAVLEGQVHLGVPTGKSVRSIRFVDPGMTLGESVLLMGTPPPYQAVATRKSKVLVIDGERWLDEVQARPETTWEVLRHMAERRLEAMHLLAASAMRTDLSRVAGYILEHRPRVQSEAFSFELPARKLDIAANLGMSNASFSRALQRLKQLDFIRVSGLFIQVLKASMLEEVIREQTT